jgi:nicotinate-nucleotide adenylyltransferase
LRIAEEIGEELHLERLYFVPSSQNPHKPPSPAPYHHRVEMIRQAIAGNPRFFLGEWEAKRTPAFTRDTLEELHSLFPGVRWVLLLGEDAFRDFPSWKDPKGILFYADLAVAHRSLNPLPEEDLLQKLCFHVSLTPVKRDRYWEVRGIPERTPRIYFPLTTFLEISSTEIRKKVASQRSCRYLLPLEVEEYIRDHALYKEP